MPDLLKNQKANQKKKKKIKRIADEQWKLIDFADKRYEVSNYGRVKSYHFDEKEGRLLKGTTVKNFQVVTLKVGGQNKHYCVHKLVAMYFCEKQNPEDNVVIHIDWDPKNNHYKNLKWVSAAEAYSRMHKRNNQLQKDRGISSNNTKLKAEDIILMKALIKKGVKQNRIARLFGISEMQVTRIKRGENWSNIELPENYQI